MNFLLQIFRFMMWHIYIYYATYYANKIKYIINIWKVYFMMKRFFRCLNSNQKKLLELST
jgi:hypothetical protein